MFCETCSTSEQQMTLNFTPLYTKIFTQVLTTILVDHESDTKTKCLETLV